MQLLLTLVSDNVFSWTTPPLSAQQEIIHCLGYNVVSLCSLSATLAHVCAWAFFRGGPCLKHIGSVRPVRPVNLSHAVLPGVEPQENKTFKQGKNKGKPSNIENILGLSNLQPEALRLPRHSNASCNRTRDSALPCQPPCGSPPGKHGPRGGRAGISQRMLQWLEHMESIQIHKDTRTHAHAYTTLTCNLMHSP